MRKVLWEGDTQGPGGSDVSGTFRQQRKVRRG